MKGRLALCRAPREPLEIEEFEVRRPGADEILVRVTAAGVCGSDVHMWRGEVPFLTAMPAAPGHEMVGRIEALGAERRRDSIGRPLAVGDRVAYAYFQPCGECWTCAQGSAGCPHRYARRSALSAFDRPHFHGAFGDYYYLHSGQWVFRLDDELPDRTAVPANCALSQVTQGLDRAPLRLGDVVVIQGLGGLGIYACAVARDLGAGLVVGIDSIATRLELAREFGAHATLDLGELRTAEERLAEIDRLTNGERADVVVELAGVPEVLTEGVAMLRPGGRYVLIGSVVADATTEFAPHSIVRSGKQLIGVVTYDMWVLPRALEWLTRSQATYPFQRLVAKSFGLEEVTAALEAGDWAASSGEIGRGVIDLQIGSLA